MPCEAALRSRSVSIQKRLRQTLRVDPDEHLSSGRSHFDQGDMMGRIDIIFISDDRKIRHTSWERVAVATRLTTLLAHPVLNEVGYRHNLDTMFLRKDSRSGIRAWFVIVHDLTDDPCGFNPQSARSTDLRSARSTRTPFPCSEGEDMAGLQIVGLRVYPLRCGW